MTIDKKKWIFFQAAVLDTGLKFAVWCRSHAANSGTKQGGGFFVWQI